jgi:2-isopropylmalate synthase
VLDEAVAAVELARRYTRRRGVLGRGRNPHRRRLPRRDFPGGGRGRRTHGEPARHYVGYSVPHEYMQLIARIVKALGDSAIVSVHCHDDLGLAVANSLAAVEAGARQIECTINGIGERAGNCSLEEIVMAFKVRNDQLPYETEDCHRAAVPGQPVAVVHHHFRSAAEQSHRRRQRVRARSGHPPGRLPEGTTTYEIIDPKSVGVPEANWCWASTAAGTRSASAARIWAFS